MNFDRAIMDIQRFIVDPITGLKSDHPVTAYFKTMKLALDAANDEIARLQEENKLLNHWKETGTYRGVYLVDEAVAKECFKLQAENATLREIAARLEWSDSASVMDEYSCLLCYKTREEGHAPDCPYTRLKEGKA